MSATEQEPEQPTGPAYDPAGASPTESPDVITQFITVTDLKQALAISRDTTVNSMILHDVVTASNQEMDTQLKPYIGNAPFPPGNTLYAQARSVTLRYAISIWYERFGQLDRAKYALDIYEKRLAALIKAVIADKPDRSTTVFIPGRDPTSIVFQPSRVGEYIDRQFA